MELAHKEQLLDDICRILERQTDLSAGMRGFTAGLIFEKMSAVWNTRSPSHGEEIVERVARAIDEAATPLGVVLHERTLAKLASAALAASSGDGGVVEAATKLLKAADDLAAIADNGTPAPVLADEREALRSALASIQGKQV